MEDVKVRANLKNKHIGTGFGPGVEEAGLGAHSVHNASFLLPTHPGMQATGDG